MASLTSQTSPTAIQDLCASNKKIEENNQVIRDVNEYGNEKEKAIEKERNIERELNSFNILKNIVSSNNFIVTIGSGDFYLEDSRSKLIDLLEKNKENVCLTGGDRSSIDDGDESCRLAVLCEHVPKLYVLVPDDKDKRYTPGYYNNEEPNFKFAGNNSTYAFVSETVKERNKVLASFIPRPECVEVIVTAGGPGTCGEILDAVKLGTELNKFKFINSTNLIKEFRILQEKEQNKSEKWTMIDEIIKHIETNQE